MDPHKVLFLIKVQVFHQSKDLHVTMEKRKYRLFSKATIATLEKSKNDQKLKNKQSAIELKSISFRPN